MKGCKRVKAIALLLGCLMIGGGWISQAAAQDSDKPIVWRLQSTWPTGNLLHKSIQRLAEDVELMSGGRLRWEVMAGRGHCGGVRGTGRRAPGSHRRRPRLAGVTGPASIPRPVCTGRRPEVPLGSGVKNSLPG